MMRAEQRQREGKELNRSPPLLQEHGYQQITTEFKVIDANRTSIKNPNRFDSIRRGSARVKNRL